VASSTLKNLFGCEFVNRKLLTEYDLPAAFSLMEVVFPVVRSPSLRHSVADAIRTALREGELSPGEDLSEVWFATHLEVSRGPVREALLVLVEEGLLTHSPNRGFAVVNLNADDRAHIAELRLLLETRALELGRQRATAADLDRLREMKSELVRLFRDRQRPARDSMEISFHGAIWELSGNPWLINSLKRTLVPMFIFSQHLGIRNSTVDPELADRQHQLYIDYLAGTTDRSAEQCVRFHMGMPA
jgi:DNA-binding GntR family transcriptional regulator